ncbi:unnamed protein product, partial [Mesorhabditis belari]|uniref:HTH psq-type domain-containing protein n=1 Tax=Mesorhabditis belari TaxID=2138241 RepID=A0AAF3EXD0_9BILA
MQQMMAHSQQGLPHESLGFSSEFSQTSPMQQMQHLLSMLANAMSANGVNPMSLVQQCLNSAIPSDTLDRKTDVEMDSDLDDIESPLDLSKKQALKHRLPQKIDTNDNIDVVGSGSSSNSPIDPSEKAYSSSNSDPCEIDGSASRSPLCLKRNYSQVDLEAAVSDIRAGKLGTRRASVVYGIPRSTLRNKIYKLEASGEPITRNPIRRKHHLANLKRNMRKTPDCSASSSRSGSEENSDNSDLSKKGFSTTGSTSDVSSQSDDWTKNFWQNFVAQQNIQASLQKALPLPRKEPLLEPKMSAEWKRSRPKRGQYRKYDKEALEKAVRSVRLGEMSVHRAGSFYGVPHSTLEYKVKERNLLRPKPVSSNQSRDEKDEMIEESIHQDSTTDDTTSPTD